MKPWMVACLVVLAVAALNRDGAKAAEWPVSQEAHVAYRLFPTDNVWTNLLLDTRNGRVWQVGISTDPASARGQWPIIWAPQAEGNTVGRFTLYPTGNMWNFVLVDQVDGRCWQIQASNDERTRGAWSLPVYDHP